MIGECADISVARTNVTGSRSVHSRISKRDRRMGGHHTHAWPGKKGGSQSPYPRKFAVDATHGVSGLVCRSHPPDGEVQCVCVEGDARRKLDGRRWIRGGATSTNFE